VAAAEVVGGGDARMWAAVAGKKGTSVNFFEKKISKESENNDD